MSNNTNPLPTPNVVITNPDARRRLGNALYVLLVLAGIASLFVLVFPEFGGYIDVARIVLLVDLIVMFVSGAFGLGVTRPNVPTVPDSPRRDYPPQYPLR